MKHKGGQIRVIGGLLRRTPIAVVGEIEQMRPTPDRVRETLFNWLGERVLGASCLDLFAGSGVLGIEAASRGAQSVLFVEKHAQAQVALRTLIDRLMVANDPAVQSLARGLSLAKGDAQQQLARLGARSSQFDLIFLDPPFSEDWHQKLAGALPAILKDQALVYYESATELESLAPSAVVGGTAAGTFRRIRHDRAGQVHYHLFSYHFGDAS